MKELCNKCVGRVSIVNFGKIDRRLLSVHPADVPDVMSDVSDVMLDVLDVMSDVMWE